METVPSTFTSYPIIHGENLKQPKEKIDLKMFISTDAHIVT